MQYVRLIFFILTSIDFLCCRLLGEFLLPPSNVLCHTYQDLHAIMKDIGMEYQFIHACPNDHILYYGENVSKEEFTKCQISRYRIDHVTKKVPRKVLRYIPIIPHLWRLSR
jgi:hypothetical protein